MIKWKKPSGIELETNDDQGSISFAESKGWKRITVKKKTVKKKEVSEKKITETE